MEDSVVKDLSSLQVSRDSRQEENLDMKWE